MFQVEVLKCEKTVLETSDVFSDELDDLRLVFIYCLKQDGIGCSNTVGEHSGTFGTGMEWGLTRASFIEVGQGKTLER